MLKQRLCALNHSYLDVLMKRCEEYFPPLLGADVEVQVADQEFNGAGIIFVPVEQRQWTGRSGCGQRLADRTKHRLVVRGGEAGLGVAAIRRTRARTPAVITTLAFVMRVVMGRIHALIEGGVHVL